MTFARTSIASLLAFAISGCLNLQPDYHRPAVPVSSSWPTGASYAPAAPQPGGTAAADVGWRDFFADERLRKLIDISLTNNRDLRAALASIEQARAQYGIQRSALFPTINAGAGETAQRTPGDLSPLGRSGVGREFDVQLAVTAYELDFWGRVRSLKDVALQQFLATEEARRATQLSLVAEVAGAYLQSAADREHLQLARDTFKSQQTSFDLTQRRYELGAVSRLDLHQAQITVETARADVASYTTIVAQDENALALLLGTPVPADLLPDGPVQAVSQMQDLPAQLPSDVLQRRPDVLQAEHQLQSANANIGAARAAFFPRISLTGAFGSASATLGGLFETGSRAWTFAPQAALPIFDGGLNRSNLELANATRDLYLAQYEKAIQSAFREVSDALAQRGTIDEQVAANEALVNATQQYFELSDQRFRRGADDYLRVLDAQRTNYSAQQNLINVRLSKQVNLVTLYRVLGGGWTDTSASPPTASN